MNYQGFPLLRYFYVCNIFHSSFDVGIKKVPFLTWIWRLRTALGSVSRSISRTRYSSPVWECISKNPPSLPVQSIVLFHSINKGEEKWKIIINTSTVVTSVLETSSFVSMSCKFVIRRQLDTIATLFPSPFVCSLIFLVKKRKVSAHEVLVQWLKLMSSNILNGWKKYITWGMGKDFLVIGLHKEVHPFQRTHVSKWIQSW